MAGKACNKVNVGFPSRKIIKQSLHDFPARARGRPADKLHSQAANILPLDGLATSKQDPINRGHGAQWLRSRDSKHQ